MQFVPDWAPNIHPLIIHFPIVLLLGAAVIDTIAFFLRQKTGLHTGAVVVYILGAVSSIVTYLTGRAAADSIMLPPEANMPLTDHADLALLTTIFFVGYAIVRIVMLRFAISRGIPRTVWLIVLLLGFAGYALIQQTAERGGMLVYRYGVGVEPAYAPQTGDLRSEAGETEIQDAGLIMSEDGGWSWIPSHPTAWTSIFRWIEGTEETMASSIVSRENGSLALSFVLNSDPVFFVFDSPLESVQIDVQMSTDDFPGSVEIVHHFQDDQNYLFTVLSENRIQQSALVDGTVRLMDESTYQSEGVRRFRIVADRTHFRAYAGLKLITHGHGDEQPAGSVGFRLQGPGTMILDAVKVTNLGSQATSDH